MLEGCWSFVIRSTSGPWDLGLKCWNLLPLYVHFHLCLSASWACYGIKGQYLKNDCTMEELSLLNCRPETFPCQIFDDSCFLILCRWCYLLSTPLSVVTSCVSLVFQRNLIKQMTCSLLWGLIAAVWLIGFLYRPLHLCLTRRWMLYFFFAGWRVHMYSTGLGVLLGAVAQTQLPFLEDVTHVELEVPSHTYTQLLCLLWWIINLLNIDYVLLFFWILWLLINLKTIVFV